MSEQEQSLELSSSVEPDALTEQEVRDLEAAEPQAAFVSYSGQDFDVNGLVRRLENEDILVPTFGHDDDRIETAGFQRGFVWRRPQMDKFIESLLLGYPIPGIFLVKQSDNRYLVLDGQQRLSTLRYFTGGIFDKREFALRNVAEEFKGLTYKSLPDDLRRKFDNTFIQAILVSSDGSKAALNSVYNIFERLNSGGTQLTPHEIRVALYAGPIIEYIELLNRGQGWRALYGDRSPRLRDQELVLRIVALFLDYESYRRPLKKFLNDFTADHRQADSPHLAKTQQLFEQATQLLANSAGREALRLRGQQVTAALAEVLLVGLMNRLSTEASVPSQQAIVDIVTALKSDDTIQEAFTRSTADEEQLNRRLGAALAAFSEI